MTAESRERRSEAAETTIVYVDDDRRTAENVIAALREELPAAAIRHVDSVAQLLQSGLDDVDCLVSAAQLADTPGVNFVRAVREVSAAVPVLLYGDPDSPAEITAAFDAGATDYLQRVGESAPSALARKVAAIVNATDSGVGGAGSGADPSAESPPTDEYRVIAQVASDAIVTVDERSRIHYANPAVEDVFGYEPDEIVGEQLTALMPDDTVEPHLEALRQYVETGERTIDWSYLELPGERKDGTEIPLSVSFGEFERDGGQFFAGIMRDISDRKALAADLREERNLNQHIVETSPIGIVTLDADGEFRFANERAEEILGRSAEQIEELSHDDGDWDLVDADGDPLSSDRTAFGRIVENGEAVYNVEMGIRRPGGERAWLSVNGQPLTEGDEIAGAVATIQDVTERRRLAGELQEVYGRVTDAFYALDDQWRFTHANERAEELIDYRGEGLVGKRIWDVFEWAEDSKLGAEYREAMATQEPSSFELYYPEPLESWYEIHVYPSETGLSVYFNDITERKERERELEETRRRYRTLVEHFPNGAVALVDPEMRYITFGGTPEIRSLSREELEGEIVRDALPDELADAVCPGYANALDGESVRYEETVDGRCYQFHFVPVRDDDGEIFAAIGMSQDVTERREQRRALEERERDLERQTEYTDDVLDAVDDVFYVLDEDGRFQRWNESLTEVTGYSDSELESLRSPDLFRDEDEERIEAAIEECFETGSVQVELPFLTKSGAAVPYEFVATTLEDPEGRPVIAGIGRDITERREHEQQLEEFVQQQHALSQLRRKALEDADLDELFAETVERIADVFGHEYAKVLEIQEGGDELLLRSG
ncbi:MAG TPA: PAS domain S-box protein, partial [Natronoarchaeum rubrum]|nr:PAS domain S-box protein [Natronoarchaeum rubrum]